MKRAYGIGWEEHMDGTMLWPSLENIICHSLPLASTVSFHFQVPISSHQDN